MRKPIVTAEHIRKSYGKSAALRDVSFRVEKDAIYGLIGQNGSGKPTLLRILAGLIPTFGGKVAYGEAA